MVELVTLSEEETENLGLRLGEILKSGDLVCLNGELGTGKTAFARGICQAYGAERYVSSPTFTLVNEYPAPVPLYHFDLYRLSSPDELYEIGFEEYINGQGIVVIEWPDLAKDLISREHIQVDIIRGKEENKRTVRISFKGKRYEGYEDRLKAAI